MYLYFKNRIDRRLEAEKLLENLRTDAGRLVGEMIQDLNRITDRNITLIESKVGDLQRILQTADKRILLLRRETEREQTAGQVYSKIRRGPFPDETETGGGEAAPSAAEIADLHRKGISPDLIANRLNLPLGEVQLMIALRDQKGKN
jgi:hypothetical protein